MATASATLTETRMTMIAIAMMMAMVMATVPVVAAAVSVLTGHWRGQWLKAAGTTDGMWLSTIDFLYALIL